MPIENRNLKAGTRLVARYHKQPYGCEVVEGEGGKVRYRLQDGREFKSPSAAGMAVTGKSCNGWAFWSVEKAEAAPATEVQQAEANQEQAAPAESAEAAGASGTISAGTGEPQGSTPVVAPAQAAVGSVQVKKGFFRTPNQRGVPEGQTRWYCHDCGGSFLSTVGETPETCPKGHRAG